jgi:endonuclease YncB( thermonuclease family)
MRKLLILTALLASTAAHAGEIEVVKGDMIRFQGTTIRLAGVVAPNWNEPGYFETNEWVANFLADKQLRCSTIPTLTRDKVLGECAYAGSDGHLRDLASAIVRNGYARACPGTGKQYIEEDEAAHRDHLGTVGQFYAPRSCFR